MELEFDATFRLRKDAIQAISVLEPKCTGDATMVIIMHAWPILEPIIAKRVGRAPNTWIPGILRRFAGQDDRGYSDKRQPSSNYKARTVLGECL